MVRNPVKSLWSFVLLASWVLLPGCSALPLASGDGIPDPPAESPDAPGENPDETGVTLAVFLDPDSDFSTPDVRDVDEEIVRFDTVAKALIWAADGSAFGAGDWEVRGTFLGAQQQFQVRFGTKDGQRRAYFTETVPATICDIFVSDARLRILPTDVAVPNG